MYQIREQLDAVLNTLQAACVFGEDWPEGEWPVSGKFHPPQFEIVVGAVLTQNTKWEYVVRGLERLAEDGKIDADSILRTPIAELEERIHSSGYFRKKARVLKRIAAAIRECPGDFYRGTQREDLLAIRGIGEETADAVLLYACERPEFVADAYARRILSRFGFFEKSSSYPQVKRFVETHLDGGVPVYKAFHALLVQHAKNVCRKVPLCASCMLVSLCARGQYEEAKGAAVTER